MIKPNGAPIRPESVEASSDEERRRATLRSLYGSVADESFVEPADPPATTTGDTPLPPAERDERDQSNLRLSAARALGRRIAEDE